MSLSQIQIIQSLGEAMNWLERELSWGVQIAELRHLTGRIGELYAALIVNGQMAPHTNERGYDVVARDGQRISVKTTTMTYSAGHVSFNPKTLDMVDRVIILLINGEDLEISILLDAEIKDARLLMGEVKGGGLQISLSKLQSKEKPIGREIPELEKVSIHEYEVVELESGTIEVLKNGEPQNPALPILKKLATELGIPLVNANGNPHNNRRLGPLIIKALRPPVME